jgi:LAGLIDADG endonuclease
LAGFTSGEACFTVSIFKLKTAKFGVIAGLRFSISQHSRDEQLMRNLVSFFECGNYFSRNNKNFGELIITKFEDLIDKVIPFFNKYPILGVKALDFEDFKKVALLMKNKIHLTSEGLEEIKKIKSGMNKGRK